MSTHLPSPPYHAYVLRIWAERLAGSDSPTVWRFSLQDTQTGGRRGFASLEQLMAYLASQTESVETQAAGQ